MISDSELVTRVTSSDDQAAYRLLVVRHQAAIRRFLCRLTAGDQATADDLAQDTFLAAYRKMHTLKSTTSLVSWLHSIAYHQFLQFARKHARQVVTADPPDSGFDPRGEVEAEIMLPKLMQMVGEEERACLTLAYAAGMTHPEISGITGLPLGTVKSHIQRGKQKLQDWLKEHDHSISTENAAQSAKEAHRA